jgi:hypothetical protein
MGMFSQGVLGGIAGGAQAYGDVLKEETKEEARIAAEERGEEMSIKKERRLSAFRKEEAEFAHELKMKEPVTVGSGSALVTKEGEEVYGNDKAGKDWNSQKNILKVDNQFAKRSDNMFQDLEYGYTEEGKAMAARVPSIASQLYREHGKNIDPNTIFLIAQKEVLENPSLDQEQIIDAINAKKGELFISDADKKEIETLKANLSSAIETEYANIPPTIKPKKGGMLSRTENESTTPAAKTPSPAQKGPDYYFEKMKKIPGFDRAKAIKSMKSRYPDWNPPSDK